MATLIYYTNGYRLSETFPTLDEAIQHAEHLRATNEGRVYSIEYEGQRYTKPDVFAISDLDILLMSNGKAHAYPRPWNLRELAAKI